MLNTTVILPVTASLPNKPSQGILTLNLNLKIIQAILPNFTMQSVGYWAVFEL